MDAGAAGRCAAHLSRLPRSRPGRRRAGPSGRRSGRLRPCSMSRHRARPPEDAWMETATDPIPSLAEPPSRRQAFFRWATYALGGLASAIVGLPLVGYLLGPRKSPERW